MIKRYYTHLAICMILWMTAFTPTSAVKLPTLAVPNGFDVNIHFRGQPRDLDLIADAGFKFIRMDLTWETVEK